MSYKIERTIPRSEKDESVSRKLANYGTATVAESQDKTGIVDIGIRPIQQGVSIAGPAVTVRCFDADNLMVHAALELCNPGDVLVIRSMTSTKHGYVGELIANSCIKRGVAGLVIDGGVRDTAAIRNLHFPIWARYISVAGTSKSRPGWVNVPIEIGGVSVSPGDFVVADDDGIVILPRHKAEDVLSAAEKRLQKEKNTRSKIADGELSVDFYGLKRVISELDIEYVENGQSAEDVHIVDDSSKVGR